MYYWFNKIEIVKNFLNLSYSSNTILFYCGYSIVPDECRASIYPQLQDLQNSVEHWRGRISSFSRELERIDDSMRDQLEKILGEVDSWKDDLTIRIRFRVQGLVLIT